jgi:hypothetical protein
MPNCNVCQRSCKTALGLSAHKTAMHSRNGKNQNGNGSKPRNGSRFNLAMGAQSGATPLMSTVANIRPLREAAKRLSGSDFLTTVTVKHELTTVADRILVSMPITPSGYPGTRITQLSELWERYRLRNFRIRYVPAVPFTLACQLVLYIDTDPNDDPTLFPTSDALIRQAVAQAGSQQWNFNVPAMIPLAKRSDDQLYYTGSDLSNERFNRQGTAYLIQVTLPMNSDGTAVTSDIEAGSLYIDWDCEFQVAQINPPIPALTYTKELELAGKTSLTVSCPAGYTVDLRAESFAHSSGAGSVTIGDPADQFLKFITTSTVTLNTLGSFTSGIPPGVYPVAIEDTTRLTVTAYSNVDFTLQTV